METLESETSIPIHSLGKLQDAVAAIAGMLGTPDVALDKKALVVMCADNGAVGKKGFPRAARK